MLALAGDGVATPAVLIGGEEDGRDGREEGGPVVVTARVGVAGTGGAKGGGSVLRRGRRSSGRRLWQNVGATNMSNGCGRSRE